MVFNKKRRFIFLKPIYRWGNNLREKIDLSGASNRVKNAKAQSNYLSIDNKISVE